MVRRPRVTSTYGGAFATEVIVTLTMLRHRIRTPLSGQLFSHAFMGRICSPVSAKTSLNLRTPSTKR